MREAIGLFLDHLSLERNLKPNSRESYRCDLEHFTDFISHRSTTHWRDVTSSDLLDYLSDLSRIGLAPSSVSRRISVLRGFFRFLLRERVIASNPAAHLQPPRLHRHLPEILTVPEIEQILETIDLDKRFGLRDRAALELLYGCGLRISELINLECNNLFFEVEHLRVTGKGGRERIVPVGEEAIRCVRIYLQNERPSLIGSESGDILILSRLGRLFTRMGMFKMIHKRVISAGITRSVSPHTFRHSFASHLIEGGASLRAVQEMLGHADITTTQIYTQLDQSYLKSVHRECHPRERILDGSGQDSANSFS